MGGDYDHAKNGLANGWAIVLSALLLNAAFFLWFRQDQRYVMGAACCFGAFGAAYLGESMHRGHLAWHPMLAGLLRAAVVLMPCAAWAAWFFATAR